ncbi:DUF6777 domain-containing protein [Actinomycetospora atypica]|uniref:DUF6777 domain-containing protein n=1 Tax=Actinomycetospora atypica TaxID=1290095 RepID=A0ABV9YE18_9PSEU
MTTSFAPRNVHHQQQQRGPQFGAPRYAAQQVGAPQVGGRPFGRGVGPQLVPGHQFPGQQFPGQQFPDQQFPGHQFHGPVPPPPAAPLPKKRPVAGKIIAGLVAAGLVVGGAGAWYSLSGSSSPALQATSFAGADPTTSPFGTDAPQVATVAADGPRSGDTAGLYAATTPPSCDDAAFLVQLQADPAKLAAWGGVFGLDAADVPAFVDSLSPVVLRAATSVTDHPFREGAFVEEPVVLAAGTAVLVNSYGEPTVKCFNGNPLSAGPQTAAAVTVVPTTRQITNYRFTSIDNSRVVVIPGKPDPKPVPGPNKPPVTVPTPDPALVKKAEEQKKLADQARQEATDSRANADSLGVNARVFRGEADRLAGLETTATARANAANGAAAKAQTDLNDAFLSFPPDRAKVERAQAALAAAKAEQANAATALITARNDASKADEEADTAESQLKNAESKARNDENVAKIAEDNAAKAKQAADDSAKKSASKKDDETVAGPDAQTPAGVDAEAAAGTDGQTPAGTDGQTPQGAPATDPEPATGQAPVTAVCQKVVTDSAQQAPICPTGGSADTAPAGTTEVGTGPVDSSSSGSDGSGSTGGSESSEQSGTGSESGSSSSESTDN